MKFIESNLSYVRTWFQEEQSSNLLVDARPDTCPLRDAKNYPLVAVPSACTRKLTTLLLVHMNPVNVGEVTGTGSKSNELKQYKYICHSFCWIICKQISTECHLLQYLATYVMPTQLSEILTRLKFIEKTYSSISARMSSGKEADFSKTSAGLDCEHLQRTINY